MQTGLSKVGVKCEELRKTGFDAEDKKISQMHELEDNWFCKVMLFSTLIVTYFRDFGAFVWWVRTRNFFYSFFAFFLFNKLKTSLIKCSPWVSYQKQMKRRAPIHSGAVHCGNYVFLSRCGIFSEHDCDVKTHLFLCRTEDFRQPHFSHEVGTFL